MLWWQWMILGTVFLGAEIAVDAEFYLVFLGISALLVGLLGATSVTLPIWGPKIYRATALPLTPPIIDRLDPVARGRGVARDSHREPDRRLRRSIGRGAALGK